MPILEDLLNHLDTRSPLTADVMQALAENPDGGTVKSSIFAGFAQKFIKAQITNNQTKRHFILSYIKELIRKLIARESKDKTEEAFIARMLSGTYQKNADSAQAKLQKAFLNALSQLSFAPNVLSIIPKEQLNTQWQAIRPNYISVVKESIMHSLQNTQVSYQTDTSGNVKTLLSIQNASTAKDKSSQAHNTTIDMTGIEKTLEAQLDACLPKAAPITIAKQIVESHIASEAEKPQSFAISGNVRIPERPAPAPSVATVQDHIIERLQSGLFAELAAATALLKHRIKADDNSKNITHDIRNVTRLTRNMFQAQTAKEHTNDNVANNPQAKFSRPELAAKSEQTDEEALHKSTRHRRSI